MSQQGRIRSTSVVFPLVVIGFGVVMLLWRWLPSFDPWPVLGKYWPLFLILVGAGMFWDRAQQQREPGSALTFPVGSTVGTLLFLVVLGFLLWRDHAFERRSWIDVTSNSAHRGHETQVVERKDAKAVRMNIQMPAGELRVNGGGQHLMEADFYQGGAWSAPAIDYSVSDGIGALRVSQEGAGHVIGNSDNVWNLKVNNEIPLELKIDMGAGRSDLNLARVDLTRLELNLGAGQADVNLTGERGKDLQAVIQGGVGEAIVHLPKNVGVVATVHGGLGSVDVHGLKEDEDGQYVNAAYGKSPNTLRLTVEGGIGHIKLEQE